MGEKLQTKDSRSKYYPAHVHHLRNSNTSSHTKVMYHFDQIYHKADDAPFNSFSSHHCERNTQPGEYPSDLGLGK
jgi:hypothetical protein